ncbi:hypothetical protein GGS24DRAFT_497845 [Hypoxylon argillaceum]|nr:hypothetical protein GGS24DRAFT_497845 [Hypoxylon argillaceum]
MAGDAPDSQFHSIVDVATASWYAHRSSTPSSKPSPSMPQDGIQKQSLTPIPAPAPAPVPVPVSVPATATATATASASVSASASPAPSSGHPAAAEVLASVASAAVSLTATPASSRRDSGEGQTTGEARDNIRSDITAWQSALQSLSPEFANVPQPLHPLAIALAEQPTLRPVEWNRYRQQGGFVPRTAHDYSSIMIYISGLINPNPCRNCLLKNGPFARCIVSPPEVLAISTLRHACANCTYQNGYKKCTNEPISEQERARSEIARPAMRAKNPAPRPPVPRKPKPKRKMLKFQRRAREQRAGEQGTGEKGTAPTTSSATNDIVGDYALFTDKLRYVRERSPRSRRRLAAETLQWQAAIATVETEESELSAAAPPSTNHRLSQSASASFTRFATPIRPESFPSGNGTTGNGTARTYEPMDEDESEGEQEDEHEESSWVRPNHKGPIIKPPQ